MKTKHNKNDAWGCCNDKPTHTPTHFESGDPDGDMYPLIEVVGKERLTAGYALSIEGQAYICRAVNAHEELLEALKWALTVMTPKYKQPSSPEYFDYARCTQAIAKAERES